MQKYNTDCYRLAHWQCLLSHLESSRKAESDLAWINYIEPLAGHFYFVSNFKDMKLFEAEFLSVASPEHKVMRSDILETAALCGICRRPYICEDDERTHSYMPKETEMKQIP